MENEGSSCNSSCLGDVSQPWPPEDFFLSEERVRCSLRCLDPQVFEVLETNMVVQFNK